MRCPDAFAVRADWDHVFEQLASEEIRKSNRYAVTIARSIPGEDVGGILPLPYAKVEPRPSARDPIVTIRVDRELGREGFTYVLESGKEGTVHSEQVLEYNQDPNYLRDAVLYKLTIEAQKRVKANFLSKREIIRRLGTSATQFYRLLDQANYSKSIDQLLSLLHVLDCEVEHHVRVKTSSRKAA